MTPPKGPLASPETAQPPMGPEARTLLASPIGDKLVGPLMQMQQQQQMGQAAGQIRSMLQKLAAGLKDTDPIKAVKLEKMAADLMTLTPPSPGPPGPQGAAGMAGPNPGGGPGGGTPPPSPFGKPPMGGPPMGGPPGGGMAGPLGMPA